MMDRYFLIFYTGSIEPEGQQIGHMHTVSTEYPNLKRVIEFLKDQNPKTSNFVITNLIELNEADFEQWSK